MKTRTIWRRPISHAVTRNPDATATGDACLDYGAGGFSAQLRFFWQMKWDDLDKRIKQTCLNAKGKKSEHGLTAINVCELIAMTVNYAAVCVAFQEKEHILPFPPVAD